MEAEKAGGKAVGALASHGVIYFADLDAQRTLQVAIELDPSGVELCPLIPLSSGAGEGTLVLVISSSTVAQHGHGYTHIWAVTECYGDLPEKNTPS